MNLGKQGADLCSPAFSQMFVATYFEHDRWQDYLHSLIGLSRRRRDTMLDALAEHFPREAVWTRPQGGLFIWVTLPEYIDTTDLLALALSHNVAFVPGRAAYLDGRGANSMRLNFSGVADEDIREGIRRIGEVVREQVDLYGTLTGAAPATGEDAPPAEPAANPDLADVLHLPPRPARDRRSDAR
jgi:2-aminoadipate transaminase